MKKHFNFKSVYRAALVALCLLTVGVGNAWGGNRRIYFDYSAVTMWPDASAEMKVHCWGGNTGDADYTMSAVAGESNLIYCDIDDGWTNLCFYRKDPNSSSWWTKTFDYNNIGSNNRFKIKNETEKDGIDKYKWADSGAAIRWNPGVCVDGLVDVHNPHTQAFSFTDNDGTYSVSLSAHSTYQFCIRDGSTRYTLDNNVWTSNISNYTLNTSGYDIRLTTAGAGTYTFAYNKNTHVISVTYPTVSHPNIDYCYLYGYDWEHKYLHLWSSASSIAGTTWPGTEMHNYFTIGDVKYYYYAPGDYANSKPNDNGGNQTDDLTNSEGYGQFQQYIGSSWGWRTFTVRIQLENEGATSAGTEYQDIAFNSGVLSDITCPEKTHYDFQGYYTEDGGIGTQVIDKDGHWLASVADYTDASKHWIHEGTSTTLYAKWTEHEYAITLSVSPAGAGTISPSSTTAKYVTASSDITAAPSHGAWIFKEWRFSKTGEDYDVYVSDGETYHSTDPTIRILAQHDGTLTAVFEPRYTLVGSIYDDSGNGGMPGYSDYTVDFTVNSTSPTVNLTCVRKLDPNTTFKFQVHDRKRNKNLGNTPAGGYISDASLECSNQDRDIPFVATGHGNYTFTISAIRQDGDAYYPTVSVSGPSSHLVNLEWADVDIDGNWWKTSRETGGTVAAVTTESGDNYPIVNGQYVAAGGSITYTATPATGYSFGGWWNTNWGYKFSDTNPYTSSSISATENVEGKFVETSTTVTLANDGNGHVEIDDSEEDKTTCGVTTTRELTAVPNEGYMFDSWSKSGDDITLSSTSTNPTTLSGNGSGATSGQTVTANFVERYSIKGTMNGENWGTTHTLSNIGTNAGSKDTCYVTMTLPANTTYEFAIYDEHTKGWYKAGTDAVYDMTYTNHTNWEFGDTKTYNCGITTAGKGTYKFIFNITDKTVTVVYPTSYQVNYGASVGGSVTSVVDGDGKAVPNGGYVVAGGSVAYTAAAASGYTFVGWCNNDSYGDTFTNINPWTNSGVAAASNAYAKFKSTNFVIYRSGDMSSDPRAAYDDVESYAGGTISEAIEFRMKVNRIDKWYTLCLPFTVTAVKVWDEEDGQYYDLVPYYRTGDKYYTGHYIIRTPVSTTDFDIENFDSRDRWVDPSSAAGYLPSANTPYIIQWHDGYFSGKYISFFGSTEESIPTSMNQGANTSSDETVNIYGNNCMTSGTVRDAYMLDPDYGSGGAWLREEVGTDRTVLPFECFIRANATTTAKYRVLRRDMADTPTGWDTVSETENKTTKVLIDNNIYIIREGRIYTIQGTLVKEGK